MAKGTKSNKQGPKAPAKKAPVKNYPTHKSSAQSVNEPDVAYGYGKQVAASSLLGGPASSLLPILSGASKKPESQMTPLEMMDIARAGISKKDLEAFKEKTALDYDKLALALAVTRATLINKKGDEKFNTSLSERIIDLANIYSYGYEVFEEEARFNQWMFRPNRALGGQAPYDLVDNQFGREEVRDIIGRLDYGVYS
jgi:putative toxin-antitoxin system antitoxin component (TIGR02293 family)